MSSHYPFCAEERWLGRHAAIALMTPARRARVAAQQAAVNSRTKSEAPKPAKPASPMQPNPQAPASGTRGHAAVDREIPRRRASRARTVDKVEEAAESASDMFARVPACRPRAATRRWDRCRMSRAS